VLAPLLHACFKAKTSSFHVPLHGNISGAKSAKEIFKPSKDSASLRVSNEKKILVLGVRFFVSKVISGCVFGLFGPLHMALGPNL